MPKGKTTITFKHQGGVVTLFVGTGRPKKGETYAEAFKRRSAAAKKAYRASVTA